MALTNIPNRILKFEMIAEILADFSDVAQTPHPVYGIPLGVGLLIAVLYKLFKPADSTNNSTYVPQTMCSICQGKGGVLIDSCLVVAKCPVCKGVGFVDEKTFERKLSLPIDTTKYGEHEFNEHGFCIKCQWEKVFLVKLDLLKCRDRRL
jgi:hypothetical protein